MTFSAVPERKPTGITEDPVFVSCTVWIIYVLSIESLTLKRLLVDIDRALEMLTAACRLFWTHKSSISVHYVSEQNTGQWQL